MTNFNLLLNEGKIQLNLESWEFKVLCVSNLPVEFTARSVLASRFLYVVKNLLLIQVGFRRNISNSQTSCLEMCFKF